MAALEMDTRAVFRSFNTYFGLGETGDATLAMREGDEITYVAPTRFNPNGGVQGAAPARVGVGVDMQLAVTGNRGYPAR